MFSYYGRKTRIVESYPPPIFDKIVEPFAGSASYALRYFENDVLLIDPYADLINMWHWLQECKPSDILSLPSILKPGQKIKDLGLGHRAAEDLLGFLTGYANERPRRTPSKQKLIERPNQLKHSLN